MKNRIKEGGGKLESTKKKRIDIRKEKRETRNLNFPKTHRTANEPEENLISPAPVRLIRSQDYIIIS